MDKLIELADILTDPALQKEVLGWKILSILFFVIFAGIIVYSYEKTSWTRVSFNQKLHEFLQEKAFETSQIEKRWEKIKQRLDKKWESEHKLAIIEADELLNEILERMGYTEKTLKEKVEKIQEKDIPLDDLKKVMAIKEGIARNPDSPLSARQAQWAIKVYEKTFSALNVF